MIYQIKNISLFGYHGLNDNEKKDGQIFKIDIFFKIDFNKKYNFTDNIDDYIDYVNVFENVKNTFNSKRYNLIEMLANDIYCSLMEEFLILNNLEVIIKKEDPLKDGKIEQVIFKYKK